MDSLWKKLCPLHCSEKECIFSFLCAAWSKKFEYHHFLVACDSEVVKLPVSHLRSLIIAPITVTPFETVLLEVFPNWKLSWRLNEIMHTALCTILGKKMSPRYYRLLMTHLWQLKTKLSLRFYPSLLFSISMVQVCGSTCKSVSSYNLHIPDEAI